MHRPVILSPVPICHVPTSAAAMLNHGLGFAETVLAAKKCNCMHYGAFIFDSEHAFAWYVPDIGIESYSDLCRWMDSIAALAHEVNAFGVMIASRVGIDDGISMILRADTRHGDVDVGFRKIETINGREVAGEAFTYEAEDALAVANELLGPSIFKRQVKKFASRDYVFSAKASMRKMQSEVDAIIRMPHVNDACKH